VFLPSVHRLSNYMLLCSCVNYSTTVLFTYSTVTSRKCEINIIVIVTVIVAVIVIVIVAVIVTVIVAVIVIVIVIVIVAVAVIVIVIVIVAVIVIVTVIVIVIVAVLSMNDVRVYICLKQVILRRVWPVSKSKLVCNCCVD